jgi:hypothetical protein
MSKRARIHQQRVHNQALANGLKLFQGTRQWYEMMTASATTIGWRLAGIQQGLADSRKPGTAELTRMISEKQAAWLQANGALVRWQASVLQQAWSGSNIWRAANLAAGTATATQWLTLSTRWTALSLSGFSQVMRPYHSRSTANARRLTRQNIGGGRR